MADKNQNLELYLKTLSSIKGELSEPTRSHLTEERLHQLAVSILDGTVFEIIKELEEIQALTEEQLLQQRMKVSTVVSLYGVILLAGHWNDFHISCIVYPIRVFL